MGIQIYPTVPVAQPEAEPWPVDEHTIRIDEMFARQLDTEFAGHVRAVLHHPETGVAALSGEAALEAITGALPALHELKARTLSQAMGPRQRSILEPLIETRLDWVAGTLGQLAQRATVEVDDASVADRIAGLQQDASSAWRDPAHLQKLGRTAVEELRYQGERRGWDPAETDTKARSGLSNLYAGAVETAIGTAINGDDLEGASALYDHAREVIDPERQAALDRRFVRAREAAVYRDIDRDMAGIPLEPAGPPAPEIFEDRAVELTPDDATDEMRARIAKVAEQAHRHAERQWHRQQAEAGVAAFDWVGRNPGRSFLAIPPDIRDWLAPDQWRGLEALLIDGRLRTDGDLFERLDWQMIYEPDSFVGTDLDRHRLSLDDEDRARFTAAQKAIAEGRIDPDLARYDRMRRGIDGAVKALGIDTEGPEAAAARADVRDRLDSFETIEGRVANGEDITTIVGEIIDGFDPRHIVQAQAGGRPPTFRPPTPPPPGPRPGPGHNQPPAQVPGTTPGRPSPLAPQPPQGTQPVPDPAGPAAVAERAAAQERTATYNTYREHLQELDPGNPLLKLEPVPGVPPDQNTVESHEREVTRVVRKKIDDRTTELKAQSTYSNDSDVRTIGGEVDLRVEFDKLKVGGTRIYKERGQYKEGGSGELYALPGSDGLQVGFRMAHDMQKGIQGSVPTLEIIVPGRDPIKFHYNSER